MSETAEVLLVAVAAYIPSERFYIPDVEVPLNICYLASHLEREGVPVRLIDMSVEPPGTKLRDAVSGRPLLVGLTAYTPVMELAARAAAEAKATWPGVPVVCGGYHASALPERTLGEIPELDYIVSGEGESALLSLARKLSNGESADDVPGLWRREDGKAVGNTGVETLDIHTLPMPARHKLPMSRYRVNPVNAMREPSTGILASRGCNHRCSYCSQSVWRKLRLREAGAIVEEMMQCGRDFGMRGFRFYDDNLLASRPHAVAFCEALIAKRAGFAWNCFSRVDAVDEELLRLMRRAGCMQVKFGVETGTARMARYLRKGTRFEQNAAAVNAARRAGIESQISLMVGLPEETEAEIQTTLRYSVTLNPDLISINAFKPFPGSIVYGELAGNDAIEPLPWSAYSVKSMRPVAKGTVTEEALTRLVRKGYMGFFLRPSYALTRLRWLFRQPVRELRRYVVGFMYLFFRLAKNTR